MTFLTHLQCPKCGRHLSAREPQNLCPCGSPLLARYDLAAIKAAVKKEELSRRQANMWRYEEFLPVEHRDNIVTLGEGWTPIFHAPNLAGKMGLPNLYIKDEGLNPTGTFKARGAAAGVSKAKELGVKAVAMPTAGNAGGAWAAYGAKAGLQVHVAMPQDAPAVNVLECQAYGAHLYLVDGLISDAGQLIVQGISEHGWYEASTLKEPYRIEGKKTMGLEIAEQFGWEWPDVIIYPAGGGVGIIGIWKAIHELAEVGWVSGEWPRLMIVQSEGCAPMVKAFQEGKSESDFWEGAQTVAAGLRVPKALGDFLVLRAIAETDGYAVAVSEEEILRAMRDMARYEGIFPCPEGAATLAALHRMQEQGVVSPTDRIVLLNTGNGLKYADLIQSTRAETISLAS
ncbi:MAG: threonine synthase [Anaerolineae bacterium]